MHQERIIIRGLNWLGDAVMALPALHQLRAAYPGAHICMLTHKKLADLWSPPLIDSKIEFDKSDSVFSIASRVRAQKFTMGVVLPLSMQSALELLLAGVPKRYGIAHKGRSFLLTHPVKKLPGIAEIEKRSNAEIRRLSAMGERGDEQPIPVESHHVYRYLRLVASLGAAGRPEAPSLSLSEDEIEQVRERFDSEHAAACGPVFGMCPGAEFGAAKRWPTDRFIEAGRRLQEQTGCRWTLFGGPGDIQACDQIAAALDDHAGGARTTNLAGKTTVRELACMLKTCSLLLGNDSGPMHLAAAVGTAVAVPFSSTSAALTGPGLPGDNRHFLLTSTAPCSPCFVRRCPIDMRCLNSLEVDRMVAGVLKLHGSSRTAPAQLAVS
jgi:heptosyltransferase-2